MKICKKCGIEQSKDNFYLQKTGYLYPYCKNCNRTKSRDWKRDNQQKHYLNKMKSKFQLSFEEYEELFKKQKGLCAICGQEEKNRRLSVDHCHTTLRVRGLLCRTCNLGISYFMDDVLLLMKAIKYLK
jgi:hypothetical protein